MAMGFPTILIPAVHDRRSHDLVSDVEFRLTDEQISWISKFFIWKFIIQKLSCLFNQIHIFFIKIGSINLLCVPIGCIFSGVFTEPIGRRRAMQVRKA